MSVHWWGVNDKKAPKKAVEERADMAQSASRCTVQGRIYICEQFALYKLKKLAS